MAQTTQAPEAPQVPRARRRRHRLVIPAVVAAAFLLTVVPAALGLLTGYVQLVVTFIGINIILTVSLNLVNGYMGEFSVGHAAFMGVGAYIASITTVALVIPDSRFGAPLLPEGLSILVFPISLLLGGIAAAIFGLLVAVPSFRVRGDYLAIITLAVNFIFKSLVENIEFIGGPRGFLGMRRVVSAMDRIIDVPWMMIWTFAAVVLTIYIVHSLVNSTFGKAIEAIREDEIASELMTVNTRRVKMVAFLLSCGLAGIAGGLFAHILGFINPAGFGILKSTEVLVMVYLGGMGSISGSVISATAFTLLLEAMKPLGVFRWVVIPLILILLMRFRPTGIMGSRELPDVFPRLRRWFGPPLDERLAEEERERVSAAG
jgi:branched-chain amino acid transport system permease protein